MAADLTFPESVHRVVADVIAERERQHAKWGEQDHPDGTGPGALADLSYRCTTADAAKGQCGRAFAQGTGTYAHIMYEEVCEAFEERDLARLRTELIQVAAVAVAWVEKLDRDMEKERTDGR